MTDHPDFCGCDECVANRPRRPRRLRNLTIRAVSLVDAGANPLARIRMAKRAPDPTNGESGYVSRCAACGSDRVVGLLEPGDRGEPARGQCHDCKTIGELHGGILSPLSTAKHRDYLTLRERELVRKVQDAAAALRRELDDDNADTGTREDPVSHLENVRKHHEAGMTDPPEAVNRAFEQICEQALARAEQLEPGVTPEIVRDRLYKRVLWPFRPYDPETNPTWFDKLREAERAEANTSPVVKAALGDAERAWGGIEALAARLKIENPAWSIEKCRDQALMQEPRLYRKYADAQNRAAKARQDG